MVYPKNAENIYNNLIAYIQNPTHNLLEKYIKSIYSADTKSLMHLDAKGRSHLIDIFHLPSKIRPLKTSVDRNLAHELRNTLFHSLMKAMSSPSRTKVKAHLLLCRTKKGISPLHSVLLSGNAKILKKYLDQVYQAIEQGLITRSDYLRLLKSANRLGVTPLHQATHNGCLNVLTLFIDTLEKELDWSELRAVFNAKHKDKEYKLLWKHGNRSENAEATKALIEEKRFIYNNPVSQITEFSNDMPEDKFIFSAKAYNASRFFEFGFDIKIDSHNPTTVDDFLGPFNTWKSLPQIE